MKKHFIGATYDLTQENMNNLIEQLEQAKAAIEMQNGAEVPEFDAETIIKYFDTQYPPPQSLTETTWKGYFVAGCKHQHSQDAAKIAQLQQELEIEREGNEAFFNEAVERNKKLAASQAQVRVLRVAVTNAARLTEDEITKQMLEVALKEVGVKNG